MELDDMELERAAELAETYLNGNISDTREALEELGPLAAASLCMAIVDALGKEGDRFRRAVDRWALEESES